MSNQILISSKVKEEEFLNKYASAKAILSTLKPVDIDNLKEFILDNLSNRDGSLTINNFRAQNLVFDEQEKSGKFKLYFDIERLFCCSGTESCQVDYLDATFTHENDSVNFTISYFDWTLNN